MLVTAGLILNCILFGCLMRPLEVNNKNTREKVGHCLPLYFFNKYVKENVSTEEDIRRIMLEPREGEF